MTGNKGLAVIDGDILAFRCAAAIEKRSVEATHNDTLDVVTFDTATNFKEWAGDKAEEYTLVPKRESEPAANAIHAMKGVISRLLENTKCDKYHIVVSGKDNFRLNLPLPTRYKFSRSGNTKPEHLTECKEYLIKYHNAEVSVGCEADDTLTGYMVQGYNAKEYVVQCSIDKDAYHGPGWLFNWTTMNEPELIEGYGSLWIGDDGKTKGKGRAFMWFQILNGDPIDTYKPCELAKVRFGDTSAYKLLKDCTTDKEAIEALVKQYKKWYSKPVTYKAWDDSLHTKDWLEIMQMYADCAFMQRWEGDRLDVKKLLDNLKVSYE